MNLIWNGHACFILESSLGRIAVDPYADDSIPGLPPLRLQADGVFCSHEHSDHNARDVVALSGHVHGFTVSCIDTFHDPEQGTLRGPNRIHIFEADGLRVAHLGDLGCVLTQEQMAQLQGLDALLVPVGGFYTIDARQAQELAEQIKPRVIVPMHYSTEGVGYDTIATVDPFLALRPDTVHYDSNVFPLTASTPAQTAVLTFPL